MEINRIWAMPNKNTFSVKPIRQFVDKYLVNSNISVDPFARDSNLATYTNDLNPNTNAKYHLEAGDFLDQLLIEQVKTDLVIIDPPYSPRQVKECYDAIGRSMTTQDGWTAHSRKVWKDKIMKIIIPNAIVLNFGWNTVGMGKKLGFEIIEILLVCHGADHSDTICMAERYIGID